jgi:hypothetical protein
MEEEEAADMNTSCACSAGIYFGHFTEENLNSEPPLLPPPPPPFMCFYFDSRHNLKGFYFGWW